MTKTKIRCQISLCKTPLPGWKQHGKLTVEGNGCRQREILRCSMRERQGKWGLKQSREHGGQNVKLCNNSQSSWTVMQARPKWRPVHYRMLRSCLRDMWILWGMRFSIKQKLKHRGSSRESTFPSDTHTDQRKILLGYIGPVKAKWIIDLGYSVATGECLAWNSKQG